MIYLGSPEVDVAGDGVIVGQTEITAVKVSPRSIRDPEEKSKVLKNASSFWTLTPRTVSNGARYIWPQFRSKHDVNFELRTWHL